MSVKNNKINQKDEEIKATLETLIRRSKDGIAMIETIENCYNVLGQAATDENQSEEYKKEIEKRSMMKKDLTDGLNRYLRLYKERFGEYKEK